MRIDPDARHDLRARLADVAAAMAAWDARPAARDDLRARVAGAMRPFRHCTAHPDAVVGGADGTGDYPVVTYGDSFVYLTLAAATMYGAHPLRGLAERTVDGATVVEVTWLATSEAQRRTSLLGSFARLGGVPVDHVIGASDYRQVAGAGHSGLSDLVIPQAHDGSNLGIQLRSTGELGRVLRVIETAPAGAVVLSDGTMSLPLVLRSGVSLFFEHLRRYCCVRARERGVIFGALSKSAGLPTGLDLDAIARETLGRSDHWYLPVPDRDRDGWSPWAPDGPRVPPPGATSVLLRLHRATPVMRLDLDAFGPAADPDALPGILEAIDYASHDQRSYGYPYPLKAAHDRGSLTQADRRILRAQVVDAAVEAGMRRTAFRDAAQQTGHR